MTTTTPPVTLEEKWTARTVPVEGGHLEWTGGYTLRWRDGQYSPGVIAYRMHHGQDPVGRVLPECGHHRCIEPSHLEDVPGRIRIRSQLRALQGLPNAASLCRRGHDQTRYGRFESDGAAYCAVCKNEPATQPIRLHGAARMQAALALRDRYYAGGSVHGIAADIDRTYGYVHDLLVLAGTTFRPRGYVAEFHAKDYR